MSFDVDIAAPVGGREIACAFTAGPGCTILFGPSGAGKTSILNMIAGLRRPARGHVIVGGEVLFDAARGIDLPAEQRGAGYVFQDDRLFPHRRVAANLDYGAGRAGSGGMDRAAVIDLLGLGGLLDRWPRALSGGEARRVAIGRALLSNPRFLLLDEPLAFLDRARRDEIIAAIERLRDSLALPILMVTHDADEAARLGTQVVRVAR
ncbi:ATP-binding cassette domain-containing protein [Sphingomonas sp.]|uniref:ATP-binding cassette domain-containing protein n=1 Tax=Sphingomonas sp. TaxID=28214 RepID=UPI001DACA8C2|nr:ATP-binding cassette domain-containing protein [Sphingomonas sp.]MBX9795737.1 ATP-binding cassette domain-containing protein [Sphingomonas sp.]